MCVVELGGELPAGHSCGSTLRCERSRSLHSCHGLHHIRPGGWTGPRHSEQVKMHLCFYQRFTCLENTIICCFMIITGWEQLIKWSHVVNGLIKLRLSLSCQVFSRAAGSAGQLGVGVADHGGAGRPAFALPCDSQYRPHDHRPAGFLWLQICWVSTTSSNACVFILVDHLLFLLFFF